MKKLILILGIVLTLTFIVTTSALALGTSQIGGTLERYNPGDPNYPPIFYLNTSGRDGLPDGFMCGCVAQPSRTAYGEHGIFKGSVDGKFGTCEYKLRTFDADGIARFVVTNCSGDLTGLYLQGTSWPDGSWEGTYLLDQDESNRVVGESIQ